MVKKLKLHKKQSVFCNIQNEDKEDVPEEVMETQNKLDEDRVIALSNNSMLRSDTVYILMNNMWRSCMHELQQRQRPEQQKKILMLPQVMLISQTLTDADQFEAISREMKTVAYETFHILYAVVHMKCHYSIFVFKNEQGKGFGVDIELLHIDLLGLHGDDVKKFIARYILNNYLLLHLKK
jgi:hypothetical protein